MMSLDELRRRFPVTGEHIYLNHAGVSPLSQDVVDAMAGYNNDVLHHGIVHVQDWVARVARCRERAAQLIGAELRELALVKNTSEGVSLVANGLGLQRGDCVVVAAGEFPANHRPWQRLQAGGVKLVVAGEAHTAITSQTLMDACEQHNARVLALSWVGFHAGHRVDLEALGAFCAEREIFFFVDVIQGLGALQLDVRKTQLSACAADAHKWLLGPEGIGLLFVSEAWQDRVEPTEVGWANVRDPLDFFTQQQPWASSARRYECGTPSTALVYGFDAALGLLLQLGPASVERRVRQLARMLADAVQAGGYELLLHKPENVQAGIVAFRGRDEAAGKALAGRLRDVGVVLTERQGVVRLAPHVYNSEAELQQVIDLL